MSAEPIISRIGNRETHTGGDGDGLCPRIYGLSENTQFPEHLYSGPGVTFEWLYSEPREVLDGPALPGDEVA